MSLLPFPSPPGASPRASDRCCNVVWLRGDHDVATADRLERDLHAAVDLDDADVVVDLSCVTFMDASTIGALVAADAALQAPWILELRDPSEFAAWVLALCGFAPPAPQAVP